MKRYLIAIGILVMALCLFAACQRSEEAADNENEDDDIEVEAKLGKLTGFDHHPGYSDMDGGYHYESLQKNDSGDWVIVCTDRNSFDEPTKITTYAVDDEAVKDFESFIKQKNIVDLENRKESDEFITDYSSWSYTIRFDNSSVGGDERKDYRIEEYKKYSKRDHTLLEKLYERFNGLKKEVISETIEDENDGYDDPAYDDRNECYLDILYEYKEAQDGCYSQEEVERMGLWSELVQHGWPYAVSGDNVGYLYYDIDSDSNDELIITYYDDIVDIYGYDGTNARMAYSTPYRGITNLYPDGFIRRDYSISANDSSTTWYKFDTDLGDCFPVFERSYDPQKGESYYTFGYYHMDEASKNELIDSYSDYGDYPVWIFEWADELTAEEYENIIPKTDPIKLPTSDKLSDIVLPDDYEKKLPPLSENSNTIDGTKIEITQDMQKKMNTFLSNFAEQYMEYYDYGRPDTGELLNFAYMWSYFNKYSNIEIEGNYYKISIENINNILNRYMGYTLSDDEIKAYKGNDIYQSYCKNGYYYTPAADGAINCSFAVVESAYDVGNDNLRLEFLVYDLDREIMEPIPKEYYSYDKSKAANANDLVQSGSGYAIVKKDKDDYRLLVYEAE